MDVVDDDDDVVVHTYGIHSRSWFRQHANSTDIIGKFIVVAKATARNIARALYDN